MIKNPYKFKGPLDPANDKLVCVSRKDSIKRVSDGILWGEYWAIIAPRQFGKTTFLRQLEKKYTNRYYINFDFEVAPGTEEKFYPWLTAQLIEKIPKEIILESSEIKVNSPTEFLDFLLKLKLKKDKKKVVLLFDEIERIPSVNNFFRIWRKLFHLRHDNKELEKYSIVVTGSFDLIKMTVGETSPFNIASTHYLQSFSESESQELIKTPLKKAGVKIDDQAIEKLKTDTKGHPQLLQEICHILCDLGIKQKRKITERDVADAIDRLLHQSYNLDTLKQELKLNTILEELIRDILEGKQVRYLPYKEFSFSGTGPIKEDENGNYIIRNTIYERFLKEIIGVEHKALPKIFICLSKQDMEWKNTLCKYFDKDYHEILFIWEAQKKEQKYKLRKEIEECIDSADLSIFLLSDHSLTPYNLLDIELLASIRKKRKAGKHIFPLWIPTDGWKNIELFTQRKNSEDNL